jgi:plastocyanin
MIGEVEVVDTGEDADTPVEVAERGDDEAAQWLEEGRDAKAAWVAEDVPSTESGGVTTYEIAMGTSTEHVDVLAFHPVTAEIEAGDKIRFVNRSAAPHTASFFGTGAEPIQNPLDPRVNAPAPGPSPQVLSAAGFFNTGLVPPDAPPGATPEAARTFEFTVPRAGDYSYVCILHAASQMVGTVNAS